MVLVYGTLTALWWRPPRFLLSTTTTTLSTRSAQLPSKSLAQGEKQSHPTIDAPRTFPKWGRTRQEEDTVGINLTDVLDFLLTSSQFAASSSGDDDQHTYTPLQDHIHDQLGRLPETLYLIDTRRGGGARLYMSQMHRDLQRSIAHDKLNHTERLMLQALQRLQRQDETADCRDSRWPHLCRLLLFQPDKDNGGFPFLAWFGDYTGCNRDNWPAATDPSEMSRSIPLFTVAAPLHDNDCAYTWPFPNYYHIKSLRPQTRDWDDVVLPFYRQQYGAWRDKIPRVLWRGSLTGRIDNATEAGQCPRWRMVHAVQHMEASVRERLLDVAVTQLPPRARPFAEEIEADLGPIVQNQDALKFLDFQKYQALLDIDGHSWSGRFASLLCFNSVVLKVDPTYVDYFYNKYSPDQEAEAIDEIYVLRPWKQYIPVKADFSNLQEQAEFALDPRNAATVERIIEQANDWCRHALIEPVVEGDMLDVWERYVQLLTVHDRHWPEQWRAARKKILSTESPLAMVELHRDDYPEFNNGAVFPNA